MKDKHNQNRCILIRILTVSLLSVVAMTWYFTSQSGQASHFTSMAIAKNIENIVARNFVINQNYYFWRNNMDQLVRKGAHFTEFFLLGFIACALFNVLLRRVWLATVISIGVCSIYAYFDEYRQNFQHGRTPRWFDWRVDVTGAILGIVMAIIVFILVRYIHRLKTRINELESVMDGSMSSHTISSCRDLEG